MGPPAYELAVTCNGVALTTGVVCVDFRKHSQGSKRLKGLCDWKIALAVPVDASWLYTDSLLSVLPQ